MEGQTILVDVMFGECLIKKIPHTLTNRARTGVSRMVSAAVIDRCADLHEIAKRDGIKEIEYSESV